MYRASIEYLAAKYKGMIFHPDNLRYLIDEVRYTLNLNMCFRLWDRFLKRKYNLPVQIENTATGKPRRCVLRFSAKPLYAERYKTSPFE